MCAGTLFIVTESEKILSFLFCDFRSKEKAQRLEWDFRTEKTCSSELENHRQQFFSRFAGWHHQQTLSNGTTSLENK